MTSRGFNLPELPEFPPRLPPFLEQYQRQSRQDYPAARREQELQALQDAHQRTKKLYQDYQEIHDLIKAAGIQYTGRSTRDSSAAAASAIANMLNGLQNDIRQRREQR